MSARLIAAIHARYVAGRIDVDELEADTEAALKGQELGTWRQRYSTEAPAGYYSEFEPKYPEATR